MNNPKPSEVLELREKLQESKYLNITAAQDYCAKLVHTSRRAWQQWEKGDRKMHPAFWELITIKLQS